MKKGLWIGGVWLWGFATCGLIWFLSWAVVQVKPSDFLVLITAFFTIVGIANVIIIMVFIGNYIVEHWEEK